jgi:ribonuclease H / adenosylcobalamin/alpha-ribazole phosphatase
VTATILLARHGSHDEVARVLSGRSEIALNAAGRAEAGRLAERLAATPLAAIHSSPRARARETAEIVAARRDMNVEIVDALDEIDFGAWTGMSFAELEGDPAWAHWNAQRGAATPPGGESAGAATGRARAHIEAIEGETVLCVSHCDVIRGLAAHYLGVHPDRMLGFDCDPASLTTLRLGEGWARVVALNERAA